MKDKEEKTQEDFEADAERADDLRQEIRWDNVYLMIEAAETKAHESLLADIEEWADSIAEGHYCSHITDLKALLESKRKI